MFSKMNRKYLLPILALAFSACSSDKAAFEGAETLTWADFPSQQELHGRILFEDEVIMPFGIQVYDSLLVSLEYENEQFCQLLNLNTQQKIGDRLSKGGGPDDAVMPMIVYNDQQAVQFNDMARGTILTYELADFISQPTVKPAAVLKLQAEGILNVVPVNKGYVASRHGQKNQLCLFDEQGKKVSEMAPYPNCLAEQYPDHKMADVYVMGLASNGSDRLAMCYYMNNLIEIYDKDGNKVKTWFGPEPQVYTLGAKNEQNIDTYFKPAPAGDSFMVLYNGRRIREEGHNSSCTKLLSFSWDGTPECVYTLDDPIFTFCVDAQRRKIYGVSETPEFHIVEYDY